MERSWFFNNGEYYGQEEFRKYFNNIYSNGIGADDQGNMHLKVSASGKALDIAPGFGIIEGYAYESDSNTVLQPVPDSNYDRIDRIVLKLDIADMIIRMGLKKGTAGSTPKPPALQRDEMIYELSLAQVRITPSGGLKVTDERFSQELCSVIRPRNLNEYKEMMKQYEKQFTDWFNAQQAKGWRNIYIQDDTPEGAVAGSIWM